MRSVLSRDFSATALSNDTISRVVYAIMRIFSITLTRSAAGAALSLLRQRREYVRCESEGSLSVYGVERKRKSAVAACHVDVTAEVTSKEERGAATFAAPLQGHLASPAAVVRTRHRRQKEIKGDRMFADRIFASRATVRAGQKGGQRRRSKEKSERGVTHSVVPFVVAARSGSKPRFGDGWRRPLAHQAPRHRLASCCAVQ
ncbi:hypothetical protein MTO96_001973 [Rhipicephalus appendiculatus]